MQWNCVKTESEEMDLRCLRSSLLKWTTVHVHWTATTTKTTFFLILVTYQTSLEVKSVLINGSESVDRLHGGDNFHDCLIFGKGELNMHRGSGWAYSRISTFACSASFDSLSSVDCAPESVDIISLLLSCMMHPGRDKICRSSAAFETFGR